MTLHRRAFIAGAAASISTRPLQAETYAASAVSLARVPVQPGHPEHLLITGQDKTPVALSEFQGQMVLLNFWAPWCLPCRREMPSLSRLASHAAGKLAVLPVSFDWRGAVGVRRFYQDAKIDNLPILLGEGENLASAFQMESLPSSALLDRHGNHVFSIVGEATWDDPKTLAWIARMASRP